MKRFDQTVPIPPHNAEAEESVLGSIIIDGEAIHKVRPILAPDDFYLQKNEWIYQAIIDLHKRHDPVDFVTLCDELERREQLEDLGGAAYVTHLINVVPSALHVESYARQVHQDAVRRRILMAVTQAAQLAYNRDHPLDDLLDQIEKTFLHLRGEIAFEDRTRTLHRLIREAYDTLEKARLDDVPIGVPSGFPDLDRLLGGFRPSNLVLVGARPSIGKSSLLTSFAANALQHDIPAVLFSLEMSGHEVAHRLLTMRTGIDVLRLQTGQLRDDEWEPLVEQSSLLADLPLWVDDTPQIKISNLRAKVRRLYAEHGVRMVLLDYVQLARPTRRYSSRYREIGEITSELKGLAKELEIPVIAASQLSRAVEQRAEGRPQLSDLRESGNQEADADVVILIHRDNSNSYEPAELILNKNRHGPTGVAHVYWQPQQVRFVSVSNQETSEPLSL